MGRYQEIEARVNADRDPTLFSVFVDDDEGYCVSNASPDLKDHLWAGRTLVLDNAPTRMAGWLRVLSMDAKVMDYDDEKSPVYLSTPTRLYRSMALHELVDIIHTGEIAGGGNHWNYFEPRPFVFFGLEMTPTLIFQGTDLERTAAVRAYFAYDKANPGRSEDDVGEFKRLFLAEFARLKETVPLLEVTAVVCETKPLRHGMHYSTEHGTTGLCGEDEVGMFPGFVKKDDIVALHWLKGQEIVKTTSLDEAATMLADLGFEIDPVHLPNSIGY